MKNMSKKNNQNNKEAVFDRVPLDELWPLVADTFEAGGRFRFFPEGTSMLPLIRAHRDSVLIEAPRKLSVGDILLYKRKNGQFVLHRLVRMTKDTLYFCGDNQVSIEKGIDRRDILARVAGIYRDDKFLTAEALPLKLYTHALSFSRPFRRVAIGAYSRVKKMLP